MFYDCNPPSKAHWLYKLFVQKVDPDTKKPLSNPDDYVRFRINPADNVQTWLLATCTRFKACRLACGNAS
jgi:hypothetical protein